MTASDRDTQLGGARRDFPSTCWSRLIGGPVADAASRRRALEELASHYWKPVYAYIRARWAKSNEDAKDLTQDFFIWMIESGFLGQADPLRGRFRAFVKVALKNFLVNVEEYRRAIKRGGEVRFVPMDALPGLEPAADPETALDETWKGELIVRATALLEESLKKEGRETCYRVFRDYHLSGSGSPDYRGVAARYGVSEQDVDNFLRMGKKRFRTIMADLVAETVSSEVELAQEWASLFGREAR